MVCRECSENPPQDEHYRCGSSGPRERAGTLVSLNPGLPEGPWHKASAPTCCTRLHPEGPQLRGTGPGLSITAIFQPCKAASVSRRVSHLSNNDDELLCPLLAPGKCQRKNSSSSLRPPCGGVWSQSLPVGCDCPLRVVGRDPQPAPPPRSPGPSLAVPRPRPPSCGHVRVRAAGAGRLTTSDLGSTLLSPLTHQSLSSFSGIVR